MSPHEAHLGGMTAAALVCCEPDYSMDCGRSLAEGCGKLTSLLVYVDEADMHHVDAEDLHARTAQHRGACSQGLPSCFCMTAPCFELDQEHQHATGVKRHLLGSTSRPGTMQIWVRISHTPAKPGLTAFQQVNCTRFVQAYKLS